MLYNDVKMRSSLKNKGFERTLIQQNVRKKMEIVQYQPRHILPLPLWNTGKFFTGQNRNLTIQDTILGSRIVN